LEAVDVIFTQNSINIHPIFLLFSAAQNRNYNMQSIRHKTNILHFKRWSRKSFAVFHSLNKVIKISALSLTITATALPGPARAQKSDTTEQIRMQKELEEVRITGEEFLEINIAPSQVVQVISREQLQNSPIESVQDVLNAVAQIDLRQRGNNDIQADISIRGGTFDQVLVMLNGVNITNPQTGHHNLDIPVSFSQIERVEILNGALSQSYGANAYSGIINIVTRRGSRNRVDVNLLAGDFGLFNVGLSANLHSAKLNNFVALNYDRSSGYTGNTDFKRATLFYNGRYHLQKSFFEWQLSGGQKAFGAQSFYTAKYPDQFEETQSALASLRFNSFGKIGTKSLVYWNMHSDRFELFRDMAEAPAWYQSHNYHLTNVAGLNSRIFLFGKNSGTTTLGADIRYEHINSNVLGLPTGDSIPSLFNPGGYYTKSDARTNISLFAEQDWEWGKFLPRLSLMVNTNTAYAGDFIWYPGLDLTYNRIPFQFKLSLNRSLRLPTFTDLYYQGPANIGNPDLKPEEAWNLDLGISYASGILKASVTSFNSVGSNSIDWVRRADTLKWQPMNVTRVETYGLDMQLDLALGRLMEGRFFIRNLNLQYTFINKNSSSGDYQSHYVLDYLRHKLVLRLNHRIFRNIYASWTMRYQQRNGNYMLWDESTGTDRQVPYGDYTLVDLRMYWKARNRMLFIDFKNLFDVHYFDYGNVLQPGRWFSVGLKWNMDWR
jgi:iron complex outermembrane receptor protein